ncbi:MAG: nucleotidyltransferase family protein [Acidimicrobiales bacterium]
MLARDQDGLLEATLALLDGGDGGDAGQWDDSSGWAMWCPAAMIADGARFRRAAFASGLTAVLASLAARRGLDLPPAWRAYAAEQVGAVAERQRRFRALLPEVLVALDEAAVAALPVKGLVVADAVWPDAAWRPMSDLDVVVNPADRARAGEALVRSGLRRGASAAWEDTYLAWGDGTVGRMDGESPEHNGKVEVHPGWVERLHHYLLSDGGVLLGEARPGTVLGAPALTLSPAAGALQVVGHLSACVVRGEVRPLNVLDAVLCLRALTPDPNAGDALDAAEVAHAAGSGSVGSFRALAARLDPRLVYPGLWLVDRYDPALASRWPDLPGTRRQLDAAARWAVLRDPTQRRNLAWRLSFTRTWNERAKVLRQWAIPPSGERGADGTGTLLGSQADRLVRATRRGTGR